MPPTISEHKPLHIESRNIDELVPYEKNSKIHDKKQVKQIAASIQEFGFNVPVLIDEQNRIIAGHGRVLAAKQLGIAAQKTDRRCYAIEYEPKFVDAAIYRWEKFTGEKAVRQN